MYWLPASFISIAQTLLLRVKRVRSFFGIPQIIVHPPEAQEESKGVMGYFKESELVIYNPQCRPSSVLALMSVFLKMCSLHSIYQVSVCLYRYLTKSMCRLYEYSLVCFYCDHRDYRVLFAGYSSSLAIAEAKQKKKDAMKRYNKLKKNPRPKLYDRPPHLIRVNE